MTYPTLRIDLDRAPRERWDALAAYRDEVAELVRVHTAEFSADASIAPIVQQVALAVVPAEQMEEIAGIAEITGVDEADLLLANLYYDLIKFVFTPSFGCTAIAVETPDGPLHARNLDWFAPSRVLARTTKIVELVRGGEVRARLVTWPGLVGAYSGVAPGRFSVSLNAVLSDEPPMVATPVVVRLREQLVSAPSFDAAARALTEADIPCDCLLMLVGTEAGERVVIERTPERAAQRWANGEPLVVTNDFRALGAGAAVGVLGDTACGRYDRATALAPPVVDGPTALSVLCDPRVRMDITVQQMVFRPAAGDVRVRPMGV